MCMCMLFLLVPAHTHLMPGVSTNPGSACVATNRPRAASSGLSHAKAQPRVRQAPQHSPKSVRIAVAEGSGALVEAKVGKRRPLVEDGNPLDIC